MQRAANRPGNSHERFEAPQARADGYGDHVGKLCPAADVDAVLVELDLREARMGKADDHSGDTLIAHKHVRATTQNAHDEAVVATALDDLGKFLDGTGLGKILSGAA